MTNPFEPHSLPLRNLDALRLIPRVGDATAALAEYNGLLQALVNPNIVLSPLTNREAVLSSRIEGTQATLEDVLEHEAGEHQAPEIEKDIQEILNYRKALILAKQHVVDRPISLNLILQLHQILMDSVRGRTKNPGKFRTDQNWIGPAGKSIEFATFVPPGPLRLDDHLRNWEEYVRKKDIDPLIQTAILHAQFEIIHPFNDGNGRIGRLLIPLFLYKAGRLREPSFYLSSYLEEHRETYIQRLSDISRNGEWTSWIEFFLEAIEAQALRDCDRVRRILILHDQMQEKVREVTRSQFSQAAVDAIFDRPIFGSTDFSRRSGIAPHTTLTILRQLKKAEVLSVLREKSGRRAEMLCFKPLLDIVG